MTLKPFLQLMAFCIRSAWIQMQMETQAVVIGGCCDVFFLLLQFPFPILYILDSPLRLPRLVLSPFSFSFPPIFSLFSLLRPFFTFFFSSAFFCSKFHPYYLHYALSFAMCLLCRNSAASLNFSTFVFSPSVQPCFFAMSLMPFPYFLFLALSSSRH